jgi:hypothetical protein
LGELQFVSPLTREERQWLSLFIYAGDTLSVPQSFGRRIFGGRHDLTADLLIPCYRREGNQPHSREELEKSLNPVEVLALALGAIVGWAMAWPTPCATVTAAGKEMWHTA